MADFVVNLASGSSRFVLTWNVDKGERVLYGPLLSQSCFRNLGRFVISGIVWNTISTHLRNRFGRRVMQDKQNEDNDSRISIRRRETTHIYIPFEPDSTSMSSWSIICLFTSDALLFDLLDCGVSHSCSTCLVLLCPEQHLATDETSVLHITCPSTQDARCLKREWHFHANDMASNAADALSRLTMDDMVIGRLSSDTTFTRYSIDLTRTIEKFGRTYATPLGEAEYFLPVDEEETDRLGIAHELWKNATNLLITHLPAGPVLDLGAGPGYWVQDLSELIPDVEVVGVDIYYGEYPETPNQCHFEVDDCEQNFVIAVNSVALAHARDTYLWLRDPERMVTQVYDVLSPGGWFQMDELRIAEWTCNKSKFRQWQRRLLDGARALRIGIPSMEQMNEFLDRCGYQGRSYKTYKWRSNPQVEGGSMVLDFVRHTVKATVRILVDGGQVMPDAAHRFLDEVDSELMEDDCRVEIVAQVCCAQK